MALGRSDFCDPELVPIRTVGSNAGKSFHRRETDMLAAKERRVSYEDAEAIRPPSQFLNHNMKANISTLLERAKEQPHEGRADWAQYGPVVLALRQKSWSYDPIYKWLISQGEPLEAGLYANFRRAATMFLVRHKRAVARKAQSKP